MLKGCFDGFADEDGAIPADNVGGILSMMGMKVKPSALKEIIEEIDEDGNSNTQHIFILIYIESKGSGLLEFGEFCQLAAKFLVEEDDEALKKELKEAFRIYDKDQQGYITTGTYIKESETKLNTCDNVTNMPCSCLLVARAIDANSFLAYEHNSTVHTCTQMLVHYLIVLVK